MARVRTADQSGAVYPPALVARVQVRGYSRIEGAAFVGVGPTKFDEMVADGRMPKPIRVDGRVIWDVRQLDAAFDALSDEGPVADPKWDDTAP